MKNKFLLGGTVLILSLANLSFADDVPVVDAGAGIVPTPQQQDNQTQNNQVQDNNAQDNSAGYTTDTSNMSDSERLTQLENQMNYLLSSGAINKVNSMQQTIRDLRGQIDVQQHQIQQMQDQQRKLYADLDARISQLTAGKTPATNTDNNASTSNESLSQASANLSEQDVYQKAYQYLQQQKYSQALTQLLAYLKQYPNGKYAVNAHYWIGEVYTLQGKVKQATDEFNIVVKQYPKTVKASDAMLKLGLIAYGEGDMQTARQYFTQVTQQFPDSTAAQLATQQLQQMK